MTGLVLEEYADALQLEIHRLRSAIREYVEAEDALCMIENTITMADKRNKTYAALKVIAEDAAQNADNFIPWEGGKCPVHPHALVEVKYRCIGGKYDGMIGPADGYSWRHSEQDGMHGAAMDIVAYRVISEKGGE